MPEIGVPASEQPTYPLELLRCEACGLVQLGVEVDRRVIFPPDYTYRSNTTRAMRDNFAELYRDCREMFALGPSDLCIDIGSNDGTLLSNFRDGGHPVLGIEPTRAAEDAIGHGIRTIMAFFYRETALRCRAEFGRAKIVTATNVLAHAGEIRSFVAGVAELLQQDGVFVAEVGYLASLIETLQYDTVYHEHLRFYHLGALKRLLEGAGLEIFHVQRIPAHGGSLRVYSSLNSQQELRPSVHKTLLAEAAAGLLDGTALRPFRARVVRSKLQLYDLLAGIKGRNERIYGIGASPRATTLINYVGLDAGILDGVLEIAGSPSIGRYVPGTRIPILDERRLFEDQPEYALLLSWHIADALAGNLRRNGFRGKFIVPLAEPRVLP